MPGVKGVNDFTNPDDRSHPLFFSPCTRRSKNVIRRRSIYVNSYDHRDFTPRISINDAVIGALPCNGYNVFFLFFYFRARFISGQERGKKKTQHGSPGNWVVLNTVLLFVLRGPIFFAFIHSRDSYYATGVCRGGRLNFH